MDGMPSPISTAKNTERNPDSYNNTILQNLGGKPNETKNLQGNPMNITGYS
jgi:hypothetical protein